MTADVSGSASLATLILSPLEGNLHRVLICGASRHDLYAKIGSLTVSPFIPHSHGINAEGLRQLADGLTGTVSTTPRGESGEDGRNRQFRQGIANRPGKACCIQQIVDLEENRRSAAAALASASAPEHS